MEPLVPSPEHARIAMGAMTAVALADGAINARERALLDAAAQALGVTGTVAVPTPAEAAVAVRDPVARLRIVQAMIVTAIMDGSVGDDERATVEEWARTLEVEEPRLTDLQLFAGRHHRLAVLDLLRRSPVVTDSAEAAWRHEGVEGVWRFFTSFHGLHTNAELARKWRGLGDMPSGSLGRAWFEHIVANGFAFPGERKGFPPELVKHDLAHVLGGYPTTATGECQVVAFVSGFMRRDPFSYLFMIAVHYQIGVEVFAGTPMQRFAFDPEAVIRALRRGMAVKRDLYDPDFDYWPLFPRSLEDVREELGIGE